jgi:hypothetical protein
MKGMTSAARGSGSEHAKYPEEWVLDGQLLARATITRAALVLLAAAAPGAHAEYLVSLADGPVTVIRGASLSQASEGTRLYDADIVETGEGRSAQLEDDAGTVLALGPGTRIMLGDQVAHPRERATAMSISLLTGWLKAARVVGAPTPPGRTLSIEMPLVTVQPGNGASSSPWSLVATTAKRVAAFAEAGDSALAVLNSDGGKATLVVLHAGQYAEHATGAPLRVQPRAPAEFVAVMPVAFRDPLIAVSRRLTSRHELPPAARAIDYADVSDWLTSDFAARRGFVKRFSPRLKSPEFRAQIDAHLDSLPQWRPILHPPPSSKPHVQPQAEPRYRDKPGHDDVDAH